LAKNKALKSRKTMITASSIRYGGLLVEASECSYESFKQLGLLCPICKRPVFLVQESCREAHTRKLKTGISTAVKESSVPAHFSHFQDVSKEEIEQCELKSSKITQVQREVTASKARGQRLKVLQRRLWQMLKTSYRLFYSEGTDELLQNYFFEASYMNEMRSKAYLEKLISSCAVSLSHPTNLQVIKTSFAEGCVKWSAIAEAYPKQESPIYEGFRNWPKSILDLKMHEAICLEVLDFLCTKMQRPILNKLIAYSIFNFAGSNAIYAALESQGGKDMQRYIKTVNSLDNSLLNSPELRENMVRMLQYLIEADKATMISVFSYVRDDVLQAIYFTNWAEQFNTKEG
jgi:hypothetical protein